MQIHICKWLWGRSKRHLELCIHSTLPMQKSWYARTHTHTQAAYVYCAIWITDKKKFVHLSTLLMRALYSHVFVPSHSDLPPLSDCMCSTPDIVILQPCQPTCFIRLRSNFETYFRPIFWTPNNTSVTWCRKPEAWGNRPNFSAKPENL